MLFVFLDNLYISTPVMLAPVAETGFSHRLTPYKIVGNFFGRSYLTNNQVENIFFELVTFQLRGRLLSSFPAHSLKGYRHFSDLGVAIALSQRHVDTWISSDKTNTTIHCLGEDVTSYCYVRCWAMFSPGVL